MALEYDMSTYYNIDDDSVIAQELGLPLGVIVQLPLFRESKVRAGVAGLAQMVTGVNVMEVPDIGKWVKPGQLLITTGFAIRDDKEAQQNLILSLVNKGLSGICIKTRRYLEEIPDSMLIQADNYGFPLIELSPDISFDDLIHDVLSAILHEQSAQLLQMLNIHSALMKIMIEGGGLQKIADILTQLLRNPVYVKDILNDRQACNYDQCSDEEMKMLLAAIKDKKMAPGKKNERIQVEIEGKTVNCFNLPMMVANEFYGYIRIWETGYTLTSNDIRAVERISLAAALEIARERSLREIEHRYSNEFLNHLLVGRIEDAETEIEHARKFGWDMNRNYTVALVWPLPFEGSGKDQMSNQEIKNRVMWELPKKMLDKGGQFLLGSKGDYLVILVEVGDGEAKQSQIDTLAKRKLQSILSYLSRAFSKNKIVIGLGRFYPGIRGLQQSYREAKRALRISENIPECQGIISFNDLGLYRFIYSQDREKEIQVYLREMVGKLIDYDREKNTDLIHTLQVYFKCRGNLKKVSEVLFIHYNTILYRLDRIQEISGLDLNSQDDRFNLDVALRLLAGRD